MSLRIREKDESRVPLEALRASALKKIGWEKKEGKQNQGLKSSLTVHRGTRGSSDSPWGQRIRSQEKPRKDAICGDDCGEQSWLLMRVSHHHTEKSIIHTEDRLFLDSAHINDCLGDFLRWGVLVGV